MGSPDIKDMKAHAIAAQVHVDPVANIKRRRKLVSWLEEWTRRNPVSRTSYTEDDHVRHERRFEKLAEDIIDLVNQGKI